MQSSVLAVLSFVALITRIDAHGAVIGMNGDISGATGSRNFATHKLLHGTLREYDPYSMNGIAGRVDAQDKPCGEPGQSGHSTNYLKIKSDSVGGVWDIQGGVQCKANDVIKFRVAMTANHGGINEFRYVCTDGMSPDQQLKVLDFYDKSTTLTTSAACFASNPDSNIWRNGGCYEPRRLKRPASDAGKKSYHPERPEWYILPQSGPCKNGGLPSSQGEGFDMAFQLPQSLASCSRIIVQWWWQTQNSCISPTWKKWKDAGTFPCKEGGWPTWGMKTCDSSVANPTPGTSG